jgi:hypothetical protein
VRLGILVRKLMRDSEGSLINRRLISHTQLRPPRLEHRSDAQTAHCTSRRGNIVDSTNGSTAPNITAQPRTEKLMKHNFSQKFLLRVGHVRSRGR